MTVQYDQLKYLVEADDPSLTFETERLVVRVIDNNGLLAEPVPGAKAHFGMHRMHAVVPFTHHLGYHGIRTFYDKEEKRNLVIPFCSWLNLQTVDLAGVPLDPVDERAWAGVGRGWPIRLERLGKGTRLTLDPLPQTRLRYAIEFRPAEPDAIDFSVRFVFGCRPDSGPARFRATWPLYMNAYDDVRLFYPRGPSASQWHWASLGEKPDVVLGDAVGYKHQQQGYYASDQALPLGYGRIGERALILMFSDPRVRLFVVNAGGHFGFSAVQNPAWDFEYVVEDYPLDHPVGFDGRVIYTSFTSAEQVLARYRAWAARR